MATGGGGQQQSSSKGGKPPKAAAPTKGTAAAGKSPAAAVGDDTFEWRELLPDSTGVPWKQGRILWHDKRTKAKFCFLGCVCCFLPLVLLLTLVVINSSDDDDDSGLTQTQQAWLDAHNAQRQKHCDDIGDLSYSTSLEALAKQAADQCQFLHGLAGNQYGENINRGQATLQDAVDSWYSQSLTYEYGITGFNSATRYFTQLVWKSTTEVGCSMCSDSKIYVCMYNPPGNVEGQYNANVFQPACTPAVEEDDSSDFTWLIIIGGIIMFLVLLAVVAAVVFHFLPPDTKAMARKHTNRVIRCLASCGASMKTGCFCCWTHKYSPVGVWTVGEGQGSLLGNADASSSASPSSTSGNSKKNLDASSGSTAASTKDLASSKTGNLASSKTKNLAHAKAKPRETAKTIKSPAIPTTPKSNKLGKSRPVDKE